MSKKKLYIKMSADKKKKGKEAEDDIRLDFLCSYVTKSLRVKIEKWHKLVTTEDTKDVVMQWLDDPSNRILLISVTTTGNLSPSLSFPTQCRGKSCYFLRKFLIEVTNSNIRENVIFGDMSHHPVEDLSILVDEIFFPILHNPRNHECWPKLIVEDVLSHLQELRNTIAEVSFIINVKI